MKQQNTRDMFDYDLFKEKIKQRRYVVMNTQQRTIGLREFAKQIGISTSTLSRIERGNKPDLDTVILICKWLKMDINKFIKE